MNRHDDTKGESQEIIIKLTLKLNTCYENRKQMLATKKGLEICYAAEKLLEI